MAPAYQLPIIFVWGGPNLLITSYSDGYYYGVALASQLRWPQPQFPAIFMGWPQPPIYQLFLGFFLWRVPNLLVISYFSGYFYGVAIVSAS